MVVALWHRFILAYAPVDTGIVTLLYVGANSKELTVPVYDRSDTFNRIGMLYLKNSSDLVTKFIILEKVVSLTSLWGSFSMKKKCM